MAHVVKDDKKLMEESERSTRKEHFKRFLEKKEGE